MNITVSLSDEDADRIGIPRTLEFDLDKITARELIAMEHHTKWTFEALEAGLAGRPAVNRAGEPIWEMEPDGVTRRKDPAGNPVQAMGFDLELLLVIVWLSARRIKGEEIDWASFDFHISGTAFGSDDPGKGQPPGGVNHKPSRKGTTTTRRR